VVAVNAADDPATLEVPIDGEGGSASRLDPVALPGFGDVRGSAVVGGSATLALPARSGGLFRIV
jgi:hypothetical protein